MSRTLWMLLAVFALCLVLGTLAAQDQATLPMHFKKLGLTKDQEAKILKVRGDYDVKIAALEKQLKDLKQQEQVDLQKLLTEPQKAKLKEFLEPKEKEKEKEKEKK